MVQPHSGGVRSRGAKPEEADATEHRKQATGKEPSGLRVCKVEFVHIMDPARPRRRTSPGSPGGSEGGGLTTGS